MTNYMMKGAIQMADKTLPKMMTVRQIANTGILPESAIRSMLKNGEIHAVYSGKKAFINFDNFCAYLHSVA